MPSPMLFVPALFVALALIFAGLALRVGRADAGSPARRAYRRIPVIFALVGTTLFALAFVR